MVTMLLNAVIRQARLLLVDDSDNRLEAKRLAEEIIQTTKPMEFHENTNPDQNYLKLRKKRF